MTTASAASRAYRPFLLARLFLFLLGPVLASSQSTEAFYKDCTEYSATAKSAFHELQVSFPGSAYALALRGEARFQNRQYAAALDFYRQAAAAMPGLRGLHLALSAVFLAMDNHEEADKEASREKSPDCRSEKLACDFAAGSYGEVLQQVGTLGGAESSYWRARAARELADRACNELSSLPDSVQLHKRNAELLEARSKYREAAVEWRIALKLSPGNSQLQASLASALFLSQDYQAVFPELKELVKLEPGSANANFFVGDALFESEQVEEAIPYLEKALRLNPKLLPAHVALGLAYSKLSESAKAIPHLKEGLALDRDGSIFYQLSRAFQSTGQVKLAQEMMTRYQEKHQAAGTNGTAPSHQ